MKNHFISNCRCSILAFLLFYMTEFNFDVYVWPPAGPIPIDRFVISRSIIGQGAFRDVYLAMDRHTSQPIVAKKFREGNPKLATFWDKDMKASS